MWTPPGMPKSLGFIGTQLWGLADVILAVEGAEKKSSTIFLVIFILKTSKHKVGFR